MNNFKTHEDAVDLTEKYSAYQLAKMFLASEKELEEVSEELYVLDREMAGGTCDDSL